MSLRLSMSKTPLWKLALIPVLGAVLMFVLRRHPAELPPAPPESRATSSHSAPAVAPAASKPSSAMPESSLEQAIAFDPFANLVLPVKIVEEPPPAPAPEPVVVEAPPKPKAEPVDRTASLKQLKVSAVFPSPKGAMAIIDSKTVKAGDLLSPGVRVVEIRGSEVILRVEDGEPASTTPAAETATR